MSTRIPLLIITAVALVSLAACGGGSMGTTQQNQTFTIGGTVSGLASGTSVILSNNGTDSLTVSANGSFTFGTKIASGGAYAVTVTTPPPNETCSVTGGTGTATANVTSVAVACSATAGPFTIGGTISGIPSGGSAVLVDNGTDTLTVSSNGSFTFNNTVASGGAYLVTVQTPPTGETCSVSNGNGTATANVTNVSVVCSAVGANFTISVAVTGLTGTGLVMQDNGADNLNVTTNGTFP